MHYQRLRNHGDSQVKKNARLTPLWERIQNYEPEPNTGCWIWRGACDSSGYAQTFGGGRYLKVHRVMFEAHRGPIPSGLQLDHLCRVRCCINPAHLEPVTPRENTMRGQTITAANARKTRCAQGHQFSPENTRIAKNGQRVCIECSRRWTRAYMAARRRAA